MADFDKTIDDVIKREGGAKVTHDPADKGGRTQNGISERSNPEAWADGKVTDQEAREIYLKKYVVGPGFHRIPSSHKATQTQLIDFFVTSGYEATKKLQEIVKVEVDGVFGSETLAAMLGVDDRTLNNLLMAARVRMAGRIVKRDPSQVRFLNGWLDRFLSFLR